MQETTLVPSINPPGQIGMCGFEAAERAEDMIAWLGRGPDWRRFLANDIERELYRQTPGAQLLDVMCTGEPEIVTSAREEEAGQRAIVTDFSITFPVTVRVRTAEGATWKLDIKHGYTASNINLNDDRRKLRQDFTILAHFQET